jgi:peptidoglycan/xylan/chitin deacetylase (PgdA/CDA1 family)
MVSVIPVLLYHSVPRSTDTGDPFAVPVARFASHLEAIAASGRTAVTVAEIAAALRSEGQLPERAVAITFDDGYDDTVAAVELVCARGLRAAVYVATGQLDMPGRIGRERLVGLAGDPQVELGAHTVNHPRLDELNSRRIEEEVVGSKRQLEAVLGRAVETFAYPHGAYDARARSAVVAAGYRSAVSVKNALSHGDDDPFAIARWTVRGGTSAEQLARVLDGAGAPLAWHGERLRTRGYRTARRLRRQLLPGVGR